MMRLTFLALTLICTSASASELVFKLIDSTTKKNIAVLHESKKKVAYERLGQKCILKIGTIKKQAMSYRMVEVREECKSESGSTYAKTNCSDSALDEKPYKRPFAKKRDIEKDTSPPNPGDVEFTETLKPQWDATGCQALSNSTMTVNGEKHRTETVCCRE